MSEQESLVDNGNNADPTRIKIRAPFPFNLLPQFILKKYKKLWKQFNAFKYYDVTHYFLLQLYEQIKVIIPITLYFVLFAALIFNQSAENGAVVGFGILAVILGLTLFIEGLKFALMPLGESIGRLMPEKLHIALVLMLSFVIGIAVTYAEPAIAAIAPLTSEVKRKQQPYLFYMVNNWREMLVLSIGLGVGTATVLGIIRFTRRWSLKPLIYSIGGSTIALSLFMHVANDNLRPLVNLAWDIGVVATGPVTVPIILSIGIGVSAQQEFRKHQLERETRLLQRRNSKLNTNGLIIEEEVIEDAPHEESNKKVDAFGVVTLAALLPVLCIEILSIILVYSKSIEQILKETKSVHHNSELPFLEKSPIIEVIYAFRAIVPLGVLLVVVLLVFLRGHLPEITLRKIMALDASEQKASKSEEELRVISVEGSPNFNLNTSMDVLRANKEELGLYETSEEEIARYRQEAKAGEAVVPQLRFVIDTTAFMSTQDREEMLHKQKMFNERTTSGYDISSKFLRSRSKEQVYKDTAPMVGTDFESEDSHSESYEDKDRMDIESGESSEAESRSQKNRQWLSTSMKMILLGFGFAQLGMLLFNLGLTYGMTPLAGLLGKILPTGLMAIDGVENSPLFDRSIGLLIVCLFAFFLGVLATFAEPVMNVMGSKVEQITQGQFKSSILIFAVSIGVGSGVLLGVLIILYQLSLIYFIIVGYGIALLLTHYSQEDIVNIAWDSAGVTTGPVTVPFVLALGLSFGNAVNAASGFGILACASFMPINSVLLSGLLLRYIASRRQLKNAPQTRSIPMA